MRPVLVFATFVLCLSSASEGLALSDDAALIVSQIEKSGNMKKFCSGGKEIKRKMLSDAVDAIKGTFITQRKKQEFGGMVYKTKPEASEFIRAHKC